MATTTLDELVYRVSPYVNGCPQPTILRELVNAARHTFERTLSWRYQIPLYTLDPGIFEYFFNVPDQTEVHAILRTRINGQPVSVRTFEQAADQYPKWADQYSGLPMSEVWANTPSGGANTEEFNETEFNDSPTIDIPDEAFDEAGQPRLITQLTPQKYVILPLPDNDQSYQVRMFVALKPKRTMTDYPLEIVDELEDVLIHGALRNLYTMKDAVWFDLSLAQYHASQYSYMTAERRARTNLTAARGQVRAQAQPFS
jgi:hypothetical protein